MSSLSSRFSLQSSSWLVSKHQSVQERLKMMLERLRLDQINEYVYYCPSTLFIVLKLKVVQKQLEVSDDNDNDLESPSPKITQTVHGRPRIDILDWLTVEISTSPGEARKYRCAGSGCVKTFKPRTKVRVLRHCKECLKMTSEERKVAAAASADTAPGALVAKTITQLAANELTTPSTTPMQHATSTQSTAQLLIPKPPPTVTDKYAFFGQGGRRALHGALDLAVVKLICIARLPPYIVNLNAWKDIFALQTPNYKPASCTQLSEGHILAEQEHIKKRQIDFLKTQYRISISFDGGTI
jgi:hypothetical protein